MEIGVELGESPILVIIGAVGVTLVAFFHFKVAPSSPPPRSEGEGVSRWLRTFKSWFRRGAAASTLFPPARANTAFLKFLLCRSAYTLIFLGFYLAVVDVTGLANPTWS